LRTGEIAGNFPPTFLPQVQKLPVNLLRQGCHGSNGPMAPRIITQVANGQRVQHPIHVDQPFTE
jgi:hypothetical protein